MEFKKLEIKPEGSWIKRTFASKHFKKTVLYILIGAAAGFLYYYFTEGNKLETMPMEDIGRSLLFGGFFGFFITNSPCARGRC
jgi:RsiW-degrading membrane proteinase PrsW (M82 family)